MRGDHLYANVLFYVYLAGLLLAIVATGLEGLGKIEDLFAGKRMWKWESSPVYLHTY
ncbi:hypothetical protein [Pyrobaculum aerophilum]|uniref:hypothetical protein n=1 Tax=Pyrobaculum aerophilum TaxID=13773 RepID=UPI0015F287AB|nr:hypothetical protein [Pyrobaculum aerophilum]